MSKITEKLYITKHIHTSITILNSNENNLILEALKFISIYCHESKNLEYLQDSGLLIALLNLFDKNICIVRLALRLINLLLDFKRVMSEFEDGTHDDTIETIRNCYITHYDAYLKEICLRILIKLTKNYRILNLVYTEKLLSHVNRNLKIMKNRLILSLTMSLFLELLKAPRAKIALVNMRDFDVATYFYHIKKNSDISEIVYCIVDKLTLFNITHFLEIFKGFRLVELLLETVMDAEREYLHDVSFRIIINCLKSVVMESYFAKSLEFLKFCLWVKTCEEKYLQQCAGIFLKLSSIPDIRQMLFDLSVEEAIVSLLRSSDKSVLIKTLDALVHMADHYYCCEALAVRDLIKRIYDKMHVFDAEVDSMILHTLEKFAKKSLRTAAVLKQIGAAKNFVTWFLADYQCRDVVKTPKVLDKLLQLLIHPSAKLALESVEMLHYFVKDKDDVNIFVHHNGPVKIVSALRTIENVELLTKLSNFVNYCLEDKDLTEQYMKHNLVSTLNNYSDYRMSKIQVISLILTRVYENHSPFKFFYAGQIDLWEKLGDGFYMVKGKLDRNFSFLENFVSGQVSSELTVYSIDYTCEKREVSILRHSCIVDRGRIASDPFLPYYVDSVERLICDEDSLAAKVKILSVYVNTLLNCTDDKFGKVHDALKLHLEMLKSKLGTNVIPVGFLRMGNRCEKSLLFKAIADRVGIPCSLIKQNDLMYWNEVVLISREANYKRSTDGNIVPFVVDLMYNIGKLLPCGSLEANYYCNNYY